MSNASRSSALRLALVLLASLSFTACKSDQEKREQFLVQGQEYAETEQHREAVIEFKNVLKIDPNDSAAHFGLAASYIALKQGRDAYWEFSETVRLDPSNVEARLSLGALALIARDFEQAEAQANAVAELEPENHKPYILLGNAVEAVERFDEAEMAYKKAVEIDASRSTLLALGIFYVNQERPDVGEPYFWQAAEASKDFKGYTALGRFLIQDRERFAESEAAFKNALEFAEEKELTDAYQNLAALYIATGRGEQGIAVLREGVEKIDKSTSLTYMMARYYRGIGDEETAEGLVREAVAQAPDDPEPALTLSAYLGRKGDLEGALEAVEHAIEADPTHVEARLRKAEILIDTGYKEISKSESTDRAVEAKSNPRITEGLALVEEVLAEVPSLPQAQFVKGKALLAIGEGDAGIEALRGAVDGKPDWAEARFVLGSSLASTGDSGGARAELARAVELDPTMSEARRLLATVHQSLGEHEYAIEQGRRYLEANPDHLGTRVLVAQSMVRIGKRDQALKQLETVPEEERDAAVNFALGRMWMNRGDEQKSREFLLLADAESPNNPRIIRSLFQVERALGNLDATKERLSVAIEAKPEEGQLQQTLGMIQFLEGNLQAAEESFKKAAKLNPNSLEAHQQLARFYQLTGRTDETIATYKAAIEVQPEAAKLHHFLALLYESQGEVSLAIQSYEAAIEHDARHAQAMNNLAYLLAESGGDMDRALDLAQDAKALLPNNPNTADTLGWVLYRRGVPSAAVGYLKEAVEGLDPDDPALGVIHHHLAQAYEADGKNQKAVEVLELALAELERRNNDQLAKGRKPGVSPEWANSARSMLDRLKAV